MSKTGAKIIGKKDGTWSVELWCAGFPYGMKTKKVVPNFIDIKDAYRCAKLEEDNVSLHIEQLDEKLKIERDFERTKKRELEELEELDRLTKKYKK